MPVGRRAPLRSWRRTKRVASTSLRRLLRSYIEKRLELLSAWSTLHSIIFYIESRHLAGHCGELCHTSGRLELSRLLPGSLCPNESPFRHQYASLPVSSVYLGPSNSSEIKEILLLSPFPSPSHSLRRRK